MDLLVLLYLIGFVRTLFVIIIVYFGIRLVTRYLLPLLVDKGVKKMQQKMQEQQRQQRSSRPDGEVTIENNRSNKGNRNQDQGEYVDFEEVD